MDDILENDIDKATELFTDAILSAAVDSIPVKTIRIRTTDKPWVTAELRKNIRKRDRLFKQARLKQTQHSWDRWKQQRNVVTDLNRRLKNDHILLQVNKLIEYKSNPINITRF